MKIILKVACLTLVCILSFNLLLSLNVSAEDIERTLDTEIVQISDQEIMERTNRFSINYRGTSSDLYKDSFVISFDVSSNNECVLLFNNATIVVYDSDGNVYSVLKFNKDVMQTRDRDAIIKWRGENLEFILGYGISYHFTTNGKLLEVLRYREVSDVPNPKQIERNNCVYEMKNNNKVSDLLGFGDYNMLVKRTDNGVEEVLFESESSLPFIAIFLIVFFVGLFMFAALILTSTFALIIVRRKLSKRFERQ